MSQQSHSCNKPDCYFCYYMGIKEPDYSLAVYNFTAVKRRVVYKSIWERNEIRLLTKKIDINEFNGRTLAAIYCKRYRTKKLLLQ